MPNFRNTTAERPAAPAPDPDDFALRRFLAETDEDTTPADPATGGAR
jgi:hypothetical protein